MGNAELLSLSEQSAVQRLPQFFEQSFIFNEDSLPALKSRVIDALTLLSQQIESTQRPFSGISPNHLAEKFQSLDLNTPLSSFQAALQELKTLYLDDAVYFHHPDYMAHLNCPIVYPAIIAELILSAINSSLDTWDQSAGATLIEQSLIDWTVKRLGLGSDSDGVFTSGGTQSNLMALLLARDYFCDKHYSNSNQQDGLPDTFKRFRILTSEASHFSVQKSAAILGLGYQSVIPVATNSHFQMDIDALRQTIEQTLAQGLLPIAVVATAGTTDFGSIDPLLPIADLCRKQDLWLHVDAAYGCGLLTTEKHRNKLNGIERADSVTVDYHKSFFQPVSCGAFFVKHKSRLNYVTHHADYLNPLSQKKEGVPNLVNKSIQTTRRFDALKLWLTLRIMGPKKLGDYFEQVIQLAEKLHTQLDSDPAFELIHKPQLSTLVFRYRPNTLALSCTINQAIRKQLRDTGQAMIASTKVNGEIFLKVTLLNPSTCIEQVMRIFDRIKQTGQSAEAEYHSLKS